VTTQAHRGDAGQLLWIGFPSEQLDSRTGRWLDEGRAGGAILFARNLVKLDAGCDLEAIAALTGELKARAPRGEAPPLVCVDQEGGPVQRVREPLPRWPPMLRFDEIGGDRAGELAEAVGEAMGVELAHLGFDVDFAPVLDVHTNPANPIIGERAFSTDPVQVADRALAFARGLARAGVLACGKHFPGHGDTHLDSHLELPTVDGTRTRLEAIELLPFRRAASAGIPMLMTAHVVFTALDPEQPATLSHRVITELLRAEIGYRGVIVSDDLDMKAIADHIGAGEAAVRAVTAGCDVLLACQSEAVQDAAYEALVRECERSQAFRARVAEAAGRVRALKAEHAAARPPMPPRPDFERHRALAAELSSG
jgi:beta-N-acetylhexosaminidase